MLAKPSLGKHNPCKHYALKNSLSYLFWFPLAGGATTKLLVFVSLRGRCKALQCCSHSPCTAGARLGREGGREGGQSLTGGGRRTLLNIKRERSSCLIHTFVNFVSSSAVQSNFLFHQVISLTLLVEMTVVVVIAIGMVEMMVLVGAVAR
jgi:hypothetical protein